MVLSLRKALNFSKVVFVGVTVSLVAACASTPATSLAGKKIYPLSNAVIYQNSSKEYAVISRYIYQQATLALPDKFATGEVVVMDVDETVLDNSNYQKEREHHGLGYSPESWTEWVKREEATLVPGVDGFIHEVIARNGKIALITNRSKHLDTHTWQNLQALGLPLTYDNTCIVGRSAEDKAAVEQQRQQGMINDKDLRRLQLMQGNIVCSNVKENGASHWAKPHSIIMQIGDNIEDVGQVTQESANLEKLMPRVGSEIFILPNPMYGSW